MDILDEFVSLHSSIWPELPDYQSMITDFQSQRIGLRTGIPRFWKPIQ